MQLKEDLEVHYWQFPEELFILLNDEFHEDFCNKIQIKLNSKLKNCFHKILNCKKYHAQRLFNKEIRFTIREIGILRKFIEIPKEELENNIETIGNHEDGTIIKNPKLPFSMKNIFYVASHLFFDGSFRFKKGGYFYTFEDSLTKYHKQRLSDFGDVPINLIEKENQLYFSYTIAFITAKILDIKNFKSTTSFLSEKMKSLAKKYKVLSDEIIKALITDEGSVEDKIKIELNNKRLIEDIHEVLSKYYKLRPISSRTRHKSLEKNKSQYKEVSTSWKLKIDADSIKELYNSIQPLPIEYKQEAFKSLYERKQRIWYQRPTGETKKQIVKSLLTKPKSVLELAKELNVRNGTIISHLKGHPTYSESLIQLGIANKISNKELRRGGYTNVDIFGIVDRKKAQNLLKV